MVCDAERVFGDDREAEHESRLMRMEGSHEWKLMRLWTSIEMKVPRKNESFDERGSPLAKSGGDPKKRAEWG